MRRLVSLLTLVAALSLALPAWGSGPFNIRLPRSPQGVDPEAVNVVGEVRKYTIKKGDSLLELARDFGLGYHDLAVLHRQYDPFIPPAGAVITVPTKWVIPDNRGRNIIVNTGQMRLYFYQNNATQVYTYPIGMGVLDFKTPTGVFKVVEKKVNPAWHIPKSLQAKYGMTVMPPGPDNPLGDYKLTLSWGDYGIHGTHMPLGVGRLVSHGCIRHYPEDIKELYDITPVGTTVEVIYEPVKFGYLRGRIFVEVHEDIYFKIPDMFNYALKKLEARGLAGRINWTRFIRAVEERTGAPVDITRR